MLYGENCTQNLTALSGRGVCFGFNFVICLLQLTANSKINLSGHDSAVARYKVWQINLWEGIVLTVFFKSQLLKITPHNPPHPQNSSLMALL